jgi:hypothetical protein
MRPLAQDTADAEPDGPFGRVDPVGSVAVGRAMQDPAVVRRFRRSYRLAGAVKNRGTGLGSTGFTGGSLWR